MRIRRSYNKRNFAEEKLSLTGIDDLEKIDFILTAIMKSKSCAWEYDEYPNSIAIQNLHLIDIGNWSLVEDNNILKLTGYSKDYSDRNSAAIVFAMPLKNLEISYKTKEHNNALSEVRFTWKNNNIFCHLEIWDI